MSLPMVQDASNPSGHYVTAMAPLFDGMAEYTPHEQAVIKSRFIPMIDATERTAVKAEWWDTRMFLMGFGASLVVTIGAAVNIAGFIRPAEKNIVGVAVLILSSIGTAALGLRERLKFQDVSIIARKMSNKLQRRGFLFLARADPYASSDRQEAYASFITHTERIKLQADEDNLKLKSEKDEDGSGRKPAGPIVHDADVNRDARVVRGDFDDDMVTASSSPPLPLPLPLSRFKNVSNTTDSPETRVDTSALVLPAAVVRKKAPASDSKL
jgi:hypothetical protein